VIGQLVITDCLIIGSILTDTYVFIAFYRRIDGFSLIKSFIYPTLFIFVKIYTTHNIVTFKHYRIEPIRYHKIRACTATVERAV